MTAHFAETTVERVGKVWPKALLTVTVACSGAPNVSVEGCPGCRVDGGRPDAGKADAGLKGTDAGPGDGGFPDAGAADAGGLDAGPDAGPDAGQNVDGGPLTGEVCPDAGTVPYKGLVIDLCAYLSLKAKVPLSGVQVSTLQPFSATLTDANGNYSICVTPNSPFTLVFSLPGYVTTYGAEFSLDPTVAGQLPPLVGEMQLACQSALQSYATEDPVMNLNEGILYSLMLSVTKGPPCDADDAGFAGWVFQGTLPDGGSGVGGPWLAAYLDDSGDLQRVSSTFDDGRVFVYNIGPGATYASLTATNPTYPALNSQCAPLDGVLGFTGRIFTAPGSLSFYPWITN